MHKLFRVLEADLCSMLYLYTYAEGTLGLHSASTLSLLGQLAYLDEAYGCGQNGAVLLDIIGCRLTICSSEITVRHDEEVCPLGGYLIVLSTKVLKVK